MRPRAMRHAWNLGLLSAVLAIAPSPCLGSASSRWIVRSWMSDDGLPNNNVTAIAQTPDGYLWVANPFRLARFDGVHFEAIPTRAILADHTEPITLLAGGKDGGLWLSLDHGPIVRLQDGVIQAVSNGVPDLIPETMRNDGQGALWLAYRNGVIARVHNGFLTSMPWAGGRNHSFALGADGKLWLSRDGQVGLLRDGQFHPRARVSSWMTQVAPASGGGVWICSGSQLYRYDEAGGLREFGALKTDHPASKPTALLEDQRGSVWIGTSDSGLFHFADGRFENVPTSHRQIHCLLEDRQGNLWAGTGGGGLNRIQPRAIALIGAENGLPFETVQSLCETPDGTIWAATQNGLVVRRNGQSWSVPVTLPAGSVATSMAADASGAVWIGTSNRRLYRWKDDALTLWQDGLATQAIYSLCMSRSGDLWIAGGPAAVQRFRDGKFVNLALPAGIRVLRAIAEDAEGQIWVGSSDGALLRVRGDTVTDEAPRLTGSRLSIRSLYAGSDGALWIGYAGSGLGRWKDGRLVRITAENGLHNNHISQIVADGRGWLWLGADHGISRIQEQEFEDFAEGKIRRLHSVHYGGSEGLPSLQANFGSAPGALCGRDGRLWIPMRTALAVVDPSQVRRDREPPVVRFRSLTVDDSVVAAVDPLRASTALAGPQALRLGPGHSRLVFDFTALSFASPENVSFQYRLDGFDQRWLDNGRERTVSYSRLPAGNYRFQVKAANRDNVWSDAAEVIAFSVAPFFWQTWWFRVVVLLAFTSAVIALVRYLSFRRLRLKLAELERQAALDRERARIARNLHDDLGGSLAEIGLRMKMATEDAASFDALKDSARHISGRINDLARSLDTVVWSVNPANDSLDRLAGYLCGFFQELFVKSAVRFRVDIAGEIPALRLTPEARSHIFLIVKEAASNILKHSHATEVWLRLAFRDGRFQASIEDNGRGFDLAAAEGKGRNGLTNMRSRAEELDGQFSLQSAPGQGTKIAISFPMTPC